VEACIEAPADVVWDWVRDHEGLPRWMPVREVVRRRPGAPHPDGVGAIRTVKWTGVVFDERIVDWKPGERLAWEHLGGAPLREHHAEIRLVPEGSSTRLVWSVRFRPLVPGTGRLLSRGVERLLARSIRGLQALAAATPPRRAAGDAGLR
jgi:uncharacterized membrane protein